LSGSLDAVGNGNDYPLPASLSGFGCILLGDSSGSTRDSGTFTAGDSFSWVLSRHTIKIGGEFHDVYSNSSNNYASRTMMDFSVFSNFGIPAAITGTAADQDPTLQNLTWMLLGAWTCKRKRSSSIAPGRERPPTRVNSDSMKSPGSGRIPTRFFPMSRSRMDSAMSFLGCRRR